MDGELVRATRRGELVAFDRLVERHQRRAVAVAYRLLSNRDDAMDVVQDALLKAYDKIGTLTDPERFGAWLMRIVSNLALNSRRSRALRKAEPLESPEGGMAHDTVNRADESAASPLAEVSAEELRARLDRAIEGLPEMQKQALVLFSIEKLPQKEIAGMLGCTVEAVKWHVFTARKKLKDQFREYL
jgi:RNA polymerase sigma-70 factor (ECF subfamily)